MKNLTKAMLGLALASGLVVGCGDDNKGGTGGAGGGTAGSAAGTGGTAGSGTGGTGGGTVTTVSTITSMLNTDANTAPLSVDTLTSDDPNVNGDLVAQSVIDSAPNPQAP